MNDPVLLIWVQPDLETNLKENSGEELELIYKMTCSKTWVVFYFQHEGLNDSAVPVLFSGSLRARWRDGMG